MGKIVTRFYKRGSKLTIKEAYLYDEEEWIESHPGERYATYRVIRATPEYLAPDFKAVVTDDGYVLPIKWTNYVRGRISKFGTDLGQVVVRNYTRFYSDEIPFLATKHKVLKSTSYGFARALLKTGDLEASYRASHPNISKTTPSSMIMKYARELLKKESVRSVLKQEVINAAKENDITIGWIIGKWKEKAEGEGKVAVDALKELTDIFELKDEKPKASFNFKIPLSAKELDALDSGSGNMIETAETADYEVVEDK